MSAFGIEPGHLQAIVAIFAAFPEIQRVRIFGSRALGKERPGSDLDLSIEGEDVALETLHGIQARYEELYLPWKLDLVCYEDLQNAALKDHIDRVGKEIYRNQNLQLK